MHDVIRFITGALAVVVLFGIIEGAREDYVRCNPGQPGWGMNFLGYVAIGVLVLL